MKIDKKLYILFLIIIILLLSVNICLSSSKTFSDIMINDKVKELHLDFYIYEGEYTEILNISLEELAILDFVEYDGKSLPQQKGVSRRSYIMKADFMTSENNKEDLLSLYIGMIDYPAIIILNGIRIHQIGRYKDGYNSTIYYPNHVYLSPDLLRYGDENNELYIKLLPEYEVKPFPEGIISSFSNVSYWVFWRRFLGVSLIQSVFVIAIIIFLYFMFDFFIKRFKEIKSLYFSLLCFTFAFTVFNMTFFHYSANEVISEIISRSSFPLALFFLTLFISEITGILSRSKWFKIMLLVPTLVCSIFVLVQSTKYGVHSVFNYVMNFFIGPMLALNLILLLISVIKYKNKLIIPILVGMLITIGLSIHDIIYISLDEIPYMD